MIGVGDVEAIVAAIAANTRKLRLGEYLRRYAERPVPEDSPKKPAARRSARA